jgi:hypothetical protein
MKILLSLLATCLAFCLPDSAATYYVNSRSGRDTNSGLSSQSAWRTLDRVNHAALLPGDSVLLKRGEVWRETLTPPASGSEGNTIRFGAFGLGPRPVISGSDPVPAALWVAARPLQYLPFSSGIPASIWNHGIRLIRVSTEKELNSPSKWWYDSARQRIYMEGTSDVHEIEVQKRDLNIDDRECGHLGYDNLDLRHARQGLRLFAWSSPVRDITLQNSAVSTEPSAPHGTMSAGVYASVHTGEISGITIQNNTFIPYPKGLEHWGIYFVQGVTEFRIVNNTFEPAGEDAITVWHSSHGVIAGNAGGGNGENTIDVKDSSDILITENHADNDGEYNIVVHGVDSDHLTYNVTVESNQCRRGGQSGVLTAGIVLLFTRACAVRNNRVEEAYGAGIFAHDRGGGDNELSHNFLLNNGLHQKTGAITIENASRMDVLSNTIYQQGSEGPALRVESGAGPVAADIEGNRFVAEQGRMLELTDPHAPIVVDHNLYYSQGHAEFSCGTKTWAFSDWQVVMRQDLNSQAADIRTFPRSTVSSSLQAH